MQMWNEYEVVNCFGEHLGPGLRRLFMDNSFRVADNNEFYINYCGDGPVKINQWLCTLENCGALFSCLPALHEKEGLAFPEDGKLAEEAQNKWCFIDNPGSGKRSRNRLERLCSYHEPQLLYAAAQIFSKEDKEKLYFVNNGHNPLPMKIWINGRLIFSCYKENLIRRSEGIIRLKAGCNLILVEREMIPQHKIKDMFMDTNFTFTLYPISHFMKTEKGYPFLTKELLRSYGCMTDIITPKKIFKAGEKIPYYLLAHYNDAGQKYEIQVLDTNDTEIYADSLDALQQSEIILHKDINDVLKIIVKKDGCIFAAEYIFVGDIGRRMGLTDTDSRRIKELLNILDFQKNVVRNSIYPIDNNVFYHVLENLYYLFHKKDLRGHYYLDFIETHDQGRKRSFGVLLPKDYDEEKAYPLIIQYTAGYGESAIPGLNGHYPEHCIRNNKYKDVIVAFLACDYEYLNDYELMAVGDVCNYLMGKYSVDRQRVSILGFCGSSNSCMRLLSFYPGVFSAAAFLAPYIDNETLDMMDERKSEPAHLHLLLNPSMGLFLPGIVYAKRCQADVTITPGLEHEELFALYNNEYLLSFLAGHKKMEAASGMDHSERLEHMGIAGMYTSKCSVFCEYTEEDEKDKMRELLIFMQLSKYKNLDIHIGKNWEVPKDRNIFYVFKMESLPQKASQEIWEKTGITFSERGMLLGEHQYKPPFSAVVLSKSRKKCYVIYDTVEALEKLKDLWKDFGISSMFYHDTILWNKEEGFIQQVDRL